MFGSPNNHVASLIFNAQVENEWRLPLLYQFLQISPTYRLVHDLNVSKGSSGENIPDDISTIRKVYSDCGDVWRRPVEEWWYRSARHMFEGSVETVPTLIGQIPAQSITLLSQMNVPNLEVLNAFDRMFSEFWIGDYAKQLFPDCAIVGVPLHGDRTKMKKLVCEMIDHAFLKANLPVKKAEYDFNTRSRIRHLTLEKCLFAVKYKACNSNARLKDIGNAITKRFEHKKPSSPDNEQTQRHLEAQTSEMLGKALNLAEQAALMEFPNSEKPKRTVYSKTGPTQDYKPKFDYDFIRSQISAGNIEEP